MNLGNGTCAAISAIDSVLATAMKSSYTITYTPGAANAAGLISTYTVLAVPITVSITGQCASCSSQDGVIHYNQTGAARNPPLAATACNSRFGAPHPV